MEVVASLSQGRTAAAQCGLFTCKSVPVIFEPPYITNGSHDQIKSSTKSMLIVKVIRSGTCDFYDLSVYQPLVGRYEDWGAHIFQKSRSHLKF